MKAQVLTAEYADRFPVQAWQRVVGTASQAPVTSFADAAAAPVAAAVEPVVPHAPGAPRKASDRGASAVEWVVITGIVVAIVAGVGWGISKAISNKADDACNKINNAGGDLNVTAGAASNDKSGGNGCSSK